RKASKAVLPQLQFKPVSSAQNSPAKQPGHSERGATPEDAKGGNTSRQPPKSPRTKGRRPTKEGDKAKEEEEDGHKARREEPRASAGKRTPGPSPLRSKPQTKREADQMKHLLEEKARDVIRLQQAEAREQRYAQRHGDSGGDQNAADENEDAEETTNAASVP